MLRHPVTEVFIYTAIAAAVTAAITVITRLVGYGAIFGVGVPLTFLLLAIHGAKRSGGARRHGIALGGLVEPAPDDRRSLARVLVDGLPSALRETLIAIIIAAVIFPPFVIAFYIWNQPAHGFVWRWPEGDALHFLESAATHIFVVALTEEAFFRGYVQTRLHDAWPPTSKLWRATFSWRVLLLQSALFAIVHLIDQPSPQVLAVFFPGLLFGWIRAWRGGIGAAMVFHGLCNILSAILYAGWLH